MSSLSTIIHKTRKNPLLLSSLWSLIARFTGVILNFGVIMIITNTLPKTPAGDVLLLMHFVTGFALISRLGIDQLLMKEIASAHEDDRDFRHHFLKISYLAVFALSFVFILIWIAASSYLREWFFNNGSGQIISMRDLILASSGILFFNLVILNSTFLKAVKKSAYGVLSQNALPAITFLFLIIIFWRVFTQNQNYFNLYTASLVLAGLLAALMTRSYFLKNSAPLSNDPDNIISERVVPGLIQIIKKSLPLAPVSIVSFLMIFSDAIMVGLFLPNDKVAEYSVAAKVSFIILFFLQALEATIYPRLLNIYHHQGRQLLSFFWQSSALVIGVVLFVTAFMYLVSDWLLMAFGKDYIVAKQVLGLLLLAQFLRATSLTFSFMFIIKEKVRYLNVILITALFINLLCNFIFIPAYGTEGAAMATLLANFSLVLLVVVFFYWKKLLIPLDEIYGQDKELTS